MAFTAESAKVYETTAPPMVLNATYLAGIEKRSTAKEFFARTHKLGTYSIVEALLGPRDLVQIVVDQNASWIDDFVRKALDVESFTKLTIKEIRAILKAYKKQMGYKVDLRQFLGLAPHKSLKRSKFLNIFYLDDIRDDKDHSSLILCLLGQVLIEKYSGRDSRVVYIQENRGGSYRRDYGLLLRSKRDKTVEFVDAGLVFPCIDGSTCETLECAPFDSGSEDFVRYEVLESDFRVLHPRFKWTEKEKKFSIFGGHGGELDFVVSGRTPSEKRFRKEQSQIDKAELDELVPIEIGFHPFWRRLGHTTLRVGESLFELSSKGWRAHMGGTSSARAYLFNNPYFKHQYGLFKHVGMPPLSISVSVSVPKHQAIRLCNLMTELAEADGKNREKFSLYWNNCNQGIMRVMELAGLPGFCSKGYLGFSSILSFRKLLLFPDLPVKARYVYLLPGSEISEANLRQWIPRLLYRHNTSYLEMMRAIPSLWIDGVAFGFRRVSDFIYKTLRIRLWQGTEPYFMH